MEVPSIAFPHANKAEARNMKTSNRHNIIARIERKLPRILKKILKIPFRPYWWLRSRIYRPAYKPKKYWKNRFSKYGFDMRGVGNCTLSLQENETVYLEAREVFLSFCNREKIDFSCVNALDVGSGNGFYANIFFENGGQNYLGIDITNKLFPELRKKFPNFEFRKSDITKQRLTSQFDFIIMIDVTQHIVDDDKFSFAMQNIRSHLADDGVFIVTSRLVDKRMQVAQHVVARTLDYYKKEFPDDLFSQPVPFRDKFIFSIRKKL
jgi:SAM-dependent methyltransferase